MPPIYWVYGRKVIFLNVQLKLDFLCYASDIHGPFYYNFKDYTWKGQCRSRYDTKRTIGKERRKSYRKNEEISGWKAYINTQKLKWNVLTIRDVFRDQKRHKMCSHTFALLWSRKTSVIVKTFQLSFCVFMCAFHLEISSFFP